MSVTANNSQTGVVTLAACMMMKNEEANLPRCLKSIRDIVDEIVIVDTGSTDKSIEIAESFGAKVYSHPFEGPIIDDFSKYRNLAFDYAESEWHLVIDCDEEFLVAPGFNALKFKQFLYQIHDQKSLVASAIKVEDMQKGKMVMEFNSTRVFKKGKAWYQDIVHNAPQIRSKLGAMFCPFIKIYHYGYDLTPEQKEQKRIRTTSLLMRRLEQNPEDWNAYFYLTQAYADSGDSEKALEYSEEYLKHKEELRSTNNFNKSIYFTAAHHYMKIGNKVRSKELILEGLEEVPGDLDLSMCLCEYGVWTRDTALIAMGGRQYVESYEKYHKDDAAKANRFIYSLNSYSYAYSLFYMTASMLGDGVKFLHHLVRNVVPKLPKEEARQVMNDLNSSLRQSFMKKFVPDREIKPIKVLNVDGSKVVGMQ